MSTQECKIARCSRNQQKMKPISPHLLHSYPVFHRIQYKWLHFLEESTEIPWDTRVKSIWILISVQQLEERSMHPISSQDESWFPGFYWTVRPTSNKHLKRSLPSPIRMWEAHWVFCLNWSGYQDSLNRNKVGFPWSGLNVGSCFMSQDEGKTESSVETLEKAIVLRLFWIGGVTSLWYLERHTEFKASKCDDAWLFLKMDRNPNITVPNRKWALVSCFTSRTVHIVLPSLV